ncbi:MAG TPA: glycosyltransferase family 39 protein [archaeon]|nr:glycosyltransferase family 39 protein [archaeon]
MPKLWNWTKTRPWLLVFLLALGFRVLALALNTSFWQMPLKKDAVVYHELASELLSKGYLGSQGQPTATVPPLYPFFVAGIYKISNTSKLAVLSFQAFLGALLTVYIFLTGELLFSRRAGWISALAGVLYWPFITMGMQLLSEALFVPLVVAGIYYTILAVSRRSPGPAVLGGVLFGLAALTRSVVFYFPLLVTVKLAWDYYFQKDKRLLKVAGLFLIAYLLTYTPWIVRNYLVFNQLVTTTTNSGMVLYTGNFPYQGKIFGRNIRDYELEPEERYIIKLPELEINRALKELAIKKLRSHPELLGKLLLLKTVYFWSPFDWEVLGHNEGTLNPWFVWVFLFAILGLSQFKWRSSFAIPAAFIVYIMALCYVAYGSPRLRLPVEPFIIVLASAGWWKLEGETGIKARYIAGLVIILTVGLGYFYGPVLKNCSAALLSRLGLW